MEKPRRSAIKSFPLALYLLAFLAVGRNAWPAPGDVARFNVSQASWRPPDVTAYVDVLDSDGQPVAALPSGSLSATLQGRPLRLVGIAPFERSGEGVAYLFLVDVSQSIQPAEFGEMREAINAWIADLKDNDRMAIFSFGENVKQIVDFTADRQQLSNALASVGPTDRETHLYSALKAAAEALDPSRRADLGLPNRRVIVVLSDGKDEGSPETAEDALARVQESHLPIYAIGYSRLPQAQQEKYLAVLDRFAANSGGVMARGDAASLGENYSRLRNAIRQVLVVKFSSDVPGEGQRVPLQIALVTGGSVRADTISVTSIGQLVPWWQRLSQRFGWPGLLIIALILSGVVLISIALTRKQETRSSSNLEWVYPPRNLGGIRVRLAALNGTRPGETHEIRVNGRASIGRNENCDLVVPDTEVSAEHCELAAHDGHVMIRDLGSTHGTMLNGVPVVSRQRLATGDLIRVGRTELRVDIGDAR